VARLFGNIKSKMHRLTGKTDAYQEAVTSSESENQEPAEEVFDEIKATESSKKLLVVGRESTFSTELIDYAVDMAERMSYEIVALNTAPLSCDTFKLFSDSRDKICADFQMLAEANVQPFREKAETRGITFTHVVKYTESTEVLEELRKEMGEFEFVASEEEQDAEYDRGENGERPRREIFVYSLL
jgi:hypothetical protein